jgi:hypothetical protein
LASRPGLKPSAWRCCWPSTRSDIHASCTPALPSSLKIPQLGRGLGIASGHGMLRVGLAARPATEISATSPGGGCPAPSINRSAARSLVGRRGQWDGRSAAGRQHHRHGRVHRRQCQHQHFQAHHRRQPDRGAAGGIGSLRRGGGGQSPLRHSQPAPALGPAPRGQPLA